jgi:hypothetical protein
MNGVTLRRTVSVRLTAEQWGLRNDNGGMSLALNVAISQRINLHSDDRKRAAQSCMEVLDRYSHAFRADTDARLVLDRILDLFFRE